MSFFADDVDVEIVVLGVFANNHPFIDLDPGADEQFATFLQVPQGVSS